MDRLYYFCLIFVMLSCASIFDALGSRLGCLIVKLSLSHWNPGSGVVVDCINS